MNRLFLSFVYLCLFFLSVARLAPIKAISDPLSVPNNPVGVHLLFPEEIILAEKLVNANQGDWGYITVPIQAGDRHRVKWQQFFDQCSQLHLIPIIRVATFADGPHWEQPNNYDLIDFANFLSDLHWPTQNRYVIIFNEVNRADEFGGWVSPEKYADILVNAIDIFKRHSQDFFILPAGLDNAAVSSDTAIFWQTYLKRMYLQQPEVFNRLDGWTSHAYPNPDFSSSPLYSGYNRIDSFKHDLLYLKNFTDKQLPIFITETGWSNKNLSYQTIASYYNYAFTHIWSHPQVVAITPFLLRASTEPFNQFSLLDSSDQPTLVYTTIQKYVQPGQPVLSSSPKTSSVLGLSFQSTPVLSQLDTSSLHQLYFFIKSVFAPYE